MRIFVSEEISAQVKDVLKEYGSLVLLPPFSRLDSPVSRHADMLMFYSDLTGSTVISEEYYKENSELFGGIKVELALERFSKDYPNDVWLDGCKLGGYLLCNEKYTSSTIKTGYKIINVKQGYAGCSTLKVKDRGLISSDKGICDSAGALGFDVLQIGSGGILLNGYSYGFIGGASVVLGDDVIFFGDITKHPDYKSICSFIEKYQMNMVYIKGHPLTDYGSALAIM